MMSCMSSRKAMIICLIAEYLKTISLYKVTFHQETDSYSRNNVKVKLTYLT